MSLKIAKSNFNFIEANFSDIISEIRESANGIRSDNRSIRKTILFHDFSKLICIEELDKGRCFIELYWYDWYDSNKQLIMRFHAHNHPVGTPSSVTKYDPFHIHSGDDERHHNAKFRELNDILEFIRLRQLSMRR